MRTAIATKAVSRREAARMYGVGVDIIDSAIHSGALPAKRIGGVIGPDGEHKHYRYRIHIDDLETWFNNLPEA